MVSSYKLTLRSYDIYSSWLLITQTIELYNLQMSECDTMSCPSTKMQPIKDISKSKESAIHT